MDYHNLENTCLTGKVVSVIVNDSLLCTHSTLGSYCFVSKGVLPEFIQMNGRRLD